ncbi:hypothetical protein [Streptomyces sp. NPDC003720]|uniref:hypothetical protein n=1 Tax=Streptomyces sp. NPDC003720 TaxID=3364684 RepID=UPI0036825184
MRSGVQNLSSSVAGAAPPGVPLALGEALGVALGEVGGPDGVAGGVAGTEPDDGEVDGMGVAVGLASCEGEADADGSSGEPLGLAVGTAGVESAMAADGMKTAAIAVAAARLCLSLKVPPDSDVSRALVSAARLLSGCVAGAGQCGPSVVRLRRGRWSVRPGPLRSWTLPTSVLERKGDSTRQPRLRKNALAGWTAKH